jgi:hypothetical protein
LDDKPWPAQLNKLIWEGGHDLILSLGQVVPHEVIGMANYNKNLFVGTGGSQGHQREPLHRGGVRHGADDGPRRHALAADLELCPGPFLPTPAAAVYVLTVVGGDGAGGLVTRGLFIGDTHDCFERAAELSVQVNFTVVDEPFRKVVVYLDPEEFHSTWLGNKSIYRTRMAIDDDGELVVLAPAVKTFGEDEQIDRLIRKYGYRTTPEIMRFMQENEDLQQNLSAAAHLIHGSSENRFRITYCPGELSAAEIEGVGYRYGDLQSMLRRYDPGKLKDGWNVMDDGERIYYISNPALGLWAHPSRLPAAA